MLTLELFIAVILVAKVTSEADFYSRLRPGRRPVGRVERILPE